MANCQIIVAGSVAAEPTNAPGFDGLPGSVEVWEADGRSGGLLVRKRERHPRGRLKQLSFSWATAQMAIAIPERLHFFLDTIVRHT